jgi:RNA ligase
MINFSKINQYIEEGYICKNQHPTEKLYIYNYTSYAQYDHVWDEETLLCRGLITDFENNIVARPFPKFFNVGQVEVKLPNESFDVFEKMDGSLGILYFVNDEPFIATRGSFSSTQAIFANQLLKEKYNDVSLNKEHTYLFEIIYPDNRIVVDYGEMEDLILLGIIDTQTGQELPLDTSIGFPLVKKYDGISDINELQSMAEDNREGFVIRFENGYRVKVKFEEYVRLHRILTSVNSIDIWEYLQEDIPFKEILDTVPDEFYDWVKKIELTLKTQFSAMENIAKAEYKELASRKETAAYFKTCTHPHILFAMYDRKNYDSIIWKLIKPKFEKPFVNTDKSLKK